MSPDESNHPPSPNMQNNIDWQASKMLNSISRVRLDRLFPNQVYSTAVPLKVVLGCWSCQKTGKTETEGCCPQDIMQGSTAGSASVWEAATSLAWAMGILLCYDI